MPDPLVTVILPVYNREPLVARAIESVLAQSYRPLELIVVDDGSTDGTRAVLESFGDRITILDQSHGGAYAARNLALRHARGELVAFIDSDDIWLPHRLSVQVPLMSRGETGLVYGDALHVVGNGIARARGLAVPPRRATCFQVSPPYRGRVADRLAFANFIPTVTVLARRACLEETGGFSEENRISCDYLMWFRIALRHEVHYASEIVAEYTVHAEGISYDLGRALESRIRLFAGELERTRDGATRLILRRMLFNLSLHLMLAAIRRRARAVTHPWQLAWKTAWGVAGFNAAPWTLRFALHELQRRIA